MFVSSSSLVNFFSTHAVDVAPRPELLDDPRRKAGWRVVQRVADRLRLGALLQEVSALSVEERLPRACALELGRRHAFVRILRAGRRTCKTEIEVQSRHVTRVVDRRESTDRAAPVAALQAVSRVTEARHQLREDPGDALRTVAALGRLSREAETGNRDRDDMKRVAGVAAVRQPDRSAGR